MAARRMEREPSRFFTRPIFGGFLAFSLTLGVPRSLLQNRTERFATQARRQYEFTVDITQLMSDPEGNSFVFP